MSRSAVHTTLVLILLSLCFLQSKAQGLAKDDPFAFGKNFREGMTGKRKLLLGFDSRRSFLNRREIRIFGLRFGVDYGERVRMGFGFYGLSSEYNQEFAVPNDTGGVDSGSFVWDLAFLPPFWNTSSFGPNVGRLRFPGT